MAAKADKRQQQNKKEKITTSHYVGELYVYVVIACMWGGVPVRKYCKNALSESSKLFSTTPTVPLPRRLNQVQLDIFTMHVYIFIYYL